MPRILLALAILALTIFAFIDALSVEDSDEIRGMPRGLWVLVILLFPVVGPVGWLLAGRPRRTVTPGRPGHPAGYARPRPIAPDDDPDFLSNLDADARKKDEELFRQWEEDLRKREDDLRRRDPEPGATDTPPADS